MSESRRTGITQRTRANAATNGRARPGASDPRGLLEFAAAMARVDVPAAERALRRARADGWARRAAEETAYMLILHAGFPAALEGTAAIARAWPGRARRTREGGVPEWTARGERRCAQVYGPSYSKLVANVRALNPDLAVMMIEQGYGRVLSRPGLSARIRELIAVAVLAAGGWERQLVSHLLGSERLGASPGEIRGAWRIGLSAAPRTIRAAGERAWKTAFRTARTVR